MDKKKIFVAAVVAVVAVSAFIGAGSVKAQAMGEKLPVPEFENAEDADITVESVYRDMSDGVIKAVVDYDGVSLHMSYVGDGEDEE